MSKSKVVDDELDGIDFDSEDEFEPEEEDEDGGSDPEAEDPPEAKVTKAKKGKKTEKPEKPVPVAEKKKTKKKDAKPAKKAAKAKPEKVTKKKAADDEDKPPFGEWPFKAGSVMRWSFQSAFDGIKRADFDKAIRKLDRDPKTFLKVLQQGKNGIKSGVPTHSWKLSEEGGKLKISDVKYYGPRPRKAAGEAKKGKPAKKVKTTKAVAKKKVTKAVAKKGGANKKAAKAKAA